MPGSTRPLRLPALAGALCAAALVAGCGEEGVTLAESSPDYETALMFNRNCGMCHTFAIAGAEGSATDINDRERVDGPSFNDRPESREAVLYAIRNGGFSGAIMPENIVTGPEAERLAQFVSKYAGKSAQ
ncbi:MAG TPA: hypothetical protein VGV40_09550 [Solirubrobacteraceae bacterium]|nr:hypothetical protein [Solirubrobacteraceae bacterium]